MLPETRLVKPNWLAAAIFCALAAACLVFCAPKTSGQLSGSARANFKLPRLFDFEAYKRNFNKIYSSPEEELARQQYFLSKAFRALISMVNYKAGKLSYFLSLNKMSDYTRDELKRLENPFAGKMFEGMPLVESSKPPPSESGDNSSAAGQLFSEELFPGTHLAEMLRQIAAEYPESEDVAQLVAELDQLGQREKRSTDRNKVNLDRLINRRDKSRTMPARRKARKTSKFANLDYVAPELMSEGIREQMSKVTWYKMPESGEIEQYYQQNGLNELLAQFRAQKAHIKSYIASHDNQMFIDHRESGCLWDARDQLDCASCYAFAAVAALEWLHCTQTGELLAFSEQYVIDCGHFASVGGCNGANPALATEFVHNFGTELQANYPYLGKPGLCPYDEQTDLATTGYIRMDSLANAAAPIDRWDEYLALAPMVVAISIVGPYAEYGGGIYDGAQCKPEGTHALLVVGHGIEDGQEYWLLRGSHSMQWGEEGHMKLAKNSDCIHPKLGCLMGHAHDNFKVKFRKNQHYDTNKLTNGAS